MQISKINSFYSQSYNNSYKKNKISATSFSNVNQTPAGYPYCASALAFRGLNYTSSNPKKFVEQGGTLRYDRALDSDFKPISGNLITKQDGIIINSIYKDGEKNYVEILNTDNTQVKKNPTRLNKQSKTPKPDGSVTVLYRSDNNNLVFVEDYDDKGILNESCLVEYENGKTKHSMLTIYSNDGVSVNEIRHRFLNESSANESYIERKQYFNNSQLIEEVLTPAPLENGVSAKSKATFINSLGECIKTHLIAPLFLKDDGKTPYAKAAARVITKDKEGVAFGDMLYSTIDKSYGINPIRNLVFKEMPHTMRETTKSKVTYFDADKQAPYTVELYDNDSEIPYRIINLNNNIFADIKLLNDSDYICEFHNCGEDDAQEPFKTIRVKRVGDCYFPAAR